MTRPVSLRGWEMACRCGGAQARRSTAQHGQHGTARYGTARHASAHRGQPLHGNGVAHMVIQVGRDARPIGGDERNAHGHGLERWEGVSCEVRCVMDAGLRGQALPFTEVRPGADRQPTSFCSRRCAQHGGPLASGPPNRASPPRAAGPSPRRDWEARTRRRPCRTCGCART
jgi:hypothetical protein